MKLFCKACVCIPFAIFKFLLVLCIVTFHSLWKLLQEITTSAARQAVSNKASDCLYDEANGMYRFERGGYRHGNRIWGNISSSSMQNFHCHLQGTDIQSTGFIVGIVFSAESFHVMYFSNKDSYVFFYVLAWQVGEIQSDFTLSWIEAPHLHSATSEPEYGPSVPKHILSKSHQQSSTKC